ncbi:hypothetical protein [Alienimonas sp. DA493]|uniref:hypothetical protein n=1 Tax=Alienimonas sp. DA493 TaxID=3373605 RepID=UPI003754DA74
MIRSARASGLTPYAVACVLLGGCGGSSENPIDVLRVTSIQTAQLSGPSLSADMKSITREDARTLLEAMSPSRIDAAPHAGVYPYRLSIMAAGNVADLQIALVDDEVHVLLDDKFYSGGDAQRFRKAYRSIVED